MNDTAIRDTPGKLGVATEGNFNIFKILGTSDKELVHSAFLKFLLKEKKEAFCSFFGIDVPEFSTVTLEKQRSVVDTLKNGKVQKVKGRIDVKAVNSETYPVLIIENKFKSFPGRKQLEKYDRIYESFSDPKPVKLLICFDPYLFPYRKDFEPEWTFIGYRELLDFLKESFDATDMSAKTLFVEHYQRFLSDLYREYEKCAENYRPLLAAPKRKGHKFWIQLMNSALCIQLREVLKNEKVEYDLNPRNTAVPVLNLRPEQWSEKLYEFLIQLQGDDPNVSLPLEVPVMMKLEGHEDSLV